MGKFASGIFVCSLLAGLLTNAIVDCANKGDVFGVALFTTITCIFVFYSIVMVAEDD